jgi:glycine cleavage system H protein
MTTYFTKEHEWVTVHEDGTATVGITDHAQDELGDVVFVELPTVGTDVAAGATVGVVESVKAVSDIYMPVTGTIEAVNDALTDAPETVNSDPQGTGWFFRIRLAPGTDFDALLTAEAYDQFLAGL